jgi:polar amino acid transport system permease protein
LEVIRLIKEMLPAAGTTLQLTVMAGLLGVVAALLAGFARLSRYRLIRWVSTVYVEVFRGMSALVQLFWAYFALPFFGISLSATTAAVLVLGLNVSAYGSEVVRGAVKAVPKGQHEAAIALNLSSWHHLRLVTLPQAGLAMIPPAGNLMIELLKGTALVSLISVADVSFEARRLQIATGEVTATYTALLLIYFALSLMITAFFKMAERRLSRHKRQPKIRSADVLAVR